VGEKGAQVTSVRISSGEIVSKVKKSKRARVRKKDKEAETPRSYPNTKLKKGVTMNEIFTAVSSTIPSIQIDVLTATTAVIGIALIIFGIGVLTAVLSRVGSGGGGTSGSGNDGAKGAR